MLHSELPNYHFACWVNISADNILKYFSLKIGFDTSCKLSPQIFPSLLRRQFAWSVKSCFLGKIRKILLICCLMNFSIAWLTVYNKEMLTSKKVVLITKTHLFKYIENFTTKEGKFSDKKFWYFSYFCLNIDCGYSLELPRRGGSNKYPTIYVFEQK